MQKQYTQNKVAYEHIKNDIDTLKDYYKNASTLESKKVIRDKLLFYKLKEISINSTNEDISKVQPLLVEEECSIVKKVLIYLNSINTYSSKEALVDMYIYRAILYEILNINIGASNEYKKLLKLNPSKYVFSAYKAFTERSRELNYFNKKEPKKKANKSFEIKTDIDPQNIPKSAKSLEMIAKYLNNSTKVKNRDLAKLYYKEALILYKQLANTHKEHLNDYILALIKAVETFNMPLALLDKAFNLAKTLDNTNQTKDYLINKIKILKENK
jgi:tetratricopeptide (TPR) repeat protein